MDVQFINLNQSIEKDSNDIKTKLSEYKLNINPCLTDVRKKEKIDYYCLQYLKDISKKISLERNNSSEGYENNIINKNSNKIKENSIMRKNKKIRVSFKDVIIEPEKNKGDYLLIYF